MATQLAGVLRHLHRLANAPDNPEWSDEQLLRRFLADRDESAFRLLVERHGRMVLSVCRHVLRQQQDAEDAFQATFLVLARKASSIQKGTALASWLYGVAYRTALKVRSDACKRRLHEKRAGESGQTRAELDVAVRELQAILAEEVNRLPEKFRAPFVLCCLEGKSRHEVAAKLGWNEGTLSTRLAAARNRLRERLLRRGVALAAALCLETVAEATAAVPAPLAQSTIETALGIASGQTAASVAPAPVAALADGVMRGLWLNKIKYAGVLIVLAGLVAAGGVAPIHRLFAVPSGDEQRATTVRPAEEPTPEKTTARADESIVVSGRVVDSDGKIVASAAIRMKIYSLNKKGSADIRATTGQDGRFRFNISKGNWEGLGLLIATAKGYGPDWAKLDGPRDKVSETTLHLVKDDVAITGRILNLEAKPVAGAIVRVYRIGKKNNAYELSRWVEDQLQWLKFSRHHYVNDPESTLQSAELADSSMSATTGADGRFRLTGVGRDRAVVLDIQGPGIEHRRVWAVTLADPLKALANRTTGLYGPTFDHLARPAKPVTGTVRDKKTGRPVAGVRVIGRVPNMGYARGGSPVETFTDANGNYRLDGLSKDKQYAVTVDTLPGMTYVPEEIVMEDTEGLRPMTADFTLDRASVVEGRLINRDTGKPVRGYVRYFLLPGNERLLRFQPWARGELAHLMLSGQAVGNNGRFKFLVPPGPGVLCALGQGDNFLRALVSAEDTRSGVGKLAMNVEYEEVHGIMPMNADAYRVIRRGPEPERLAFDLELVEGRRVSGTLVGPDGRPAMGVRGLELIRPIRIHVEEKTGSFTATGVDPRIPQTLAFYQVERGLAGRIEIKGGADEPMTVRLQPWGRLKGRLVDPEGKPLTGIFVTLTWEDREGRFHSIPTGPLAKPVAADAEGRFQVEGVIPELTFRLRVLGGGKKGPPYLVLLQGDVVTVRAGETKDLGEIKFRTRRDE
jgi:RNA polymerase sigma factor (sigma-70 family)